MEISVMPLLLRGGSEGVPRPPGGTEKCKIDLFGHVQSPKYLLGENFYLEILFLVYMIISFILFLSFQIF